MLLQIVQRLAALLSLMLLASGAYLLWSWWDHRAALEAGLRLNDDFSWRAWAGGALLAWSVAGRYPVLWLLGRRAADRDRLKPPPGEWLESPTAARLHVQASGPESAPALVFVHGWGLDASIWWDARATLSPRFRVVTYDLAGLGRSDGPADGRYSLERFSDDLLAVVGSLAPRRCILVGHSIGGMILQTFARRHPETLGRQVQGLVLENTTHTDPSRTTVLGPMLAATKPVLRPAMWLDVFLSPLIRLINWQSYLSGSTHLAMRLGFGQRPTRAQLEQAALLATRNSPAVQAKGNLAMMAWDATGDMAAVRIPMLVFCGDRDIVTVARAGETIAREARSARLERISRAGHMGPVELANRYNRILEEFADRVFTRGAEWADRRTSPSAAGEAEQRPGPGRDQPGLGV